ncbi:MAG: dihydroorotate dehydrogenase electron transfer subunit [Planctomycetota bacterium]|nr:dihydroorotate dehydrogenase electron transfer subunit [Planctomycetota bacterium]
MANEPETAAKRDSKCRVAENFPAGPGFFRMRIHAPELADVFLPGQFFQLRIRPGAETPLLRRPFVPSSREPDGFSFHYAVVGRGTGVMAELSPGAPVDILAPLGNAFSPLPADRTALIIGGGLGAPGLAPLGKALASAGVRTIIALGAQTADRLPAPELFSGAADRLLFATDDGSLGFAGSVVDAVLDGAGDIFGHLSRIYACGPLAMLAAAAGLAAGRNIPCEVSLEARMACGFGACMGCVVPILGGKGRNAFLRVCREGPVFDARNVDWPFLIGVVPAF